MKYYVAVLMLFLALICNAQNKKPITRDIREIGPPVMSVIHASDVFDETMIGQTWGFQNGYGDITVVKILPAQFCEFGICDGKSVIWDWTKFVCRAYWDQGICNAELREFVLHKELDGSWVCKGFQWFDGTSQRTAVITLLPGWTPTPYTYIPASTTSPALNTAYQSQWQFGYTDGPLSTIDGSWTSTWTTYSYTQQTFSPFSGLVNSMISEQCEGGASGACNGVWEKHHLCLGIGLCAVEPLRGLDANGNFVAVDPNLTMVRIY